MEVQCFNWHPEF